MKPQALVFVAIAVAGGLVGGEIVEQYREPVTRTMSAPVVVEPYDRADWRHWVDADGDGQDTRQEILLAEANADVPVATNRNGSRVLSGAWDDPYTGLTLTDPGALDVDHMVPLGWAHAHGGAAWSSARKRDYANGLTDPDHLVAVRARENRQKGARGPAGWVPPDETAHCWYGLAWARITTAWELDLDAADALAIVGLVATCDAAAREGA